MKLTTLVITLLLASQNVNAQMQLVKDIKPGVDGSRPANFFAHNGRIYFLAEQLLNNSALWVTDGTEAGTTTIAAASGDELVGVNLFTALGNNVVFSGYNNASPGIWVTDGTDPGTVKLKDIQVEEPMIALDNKILFSGFDIPTGNGELWQTDGTDTGTYIIKDINTLKNTSGPRGFSRLDNKIVFATENDNIMQLWITDGTATGTTLVKDIDVVAPYYSLSNLHFYTQPTFAEYNGKLYFCGGGRAQDKELWVTDGTPNGTLQVTDVNNKTNSSSYPCSFTTCNNKLFFVARDNFIDTGMNRGLYVSDGTATGTIRISPSLHMEYNTSNYQLFAYGDKLIFEGDGYVWISDGTVVGTKILKPGIVGPYLFFKANNGYMYFFAFDNITGDRNLYRSDGTAQGTTIAAAINGLHDIPNVSILNGDIYLNKNIPPDLFNVELYKFTDVDAEPLQINATSQAQQKNIYPNPATNTFSVDANGTTTTVKVYSLTGQLMLQTTATSNINIRHLPVGIYIVQVNANGQTHTEKLIKE